MKRIIYLLTTALALTTLTPVSHGKDVRFNLEARKPGAGYNNTRYDRRVAQPRSILRGSPVAASSERAFNRNLGPQTRDLMRQRGDVARHARRSGPMKQTLARQAQGVRFNTAPRRPGAGYNNVRYDRRVGQPRSILKGSPANRSWKAERSFTRSLGAETRGAMRHRGDVARHARHSGRVTHKLNNVARTARKGSRLGRAGKLAAGGVAAGFATHTAGETLGMNVPDPISAGVWVFDTARDPRNAGRRIEKLGHDAVREVDTGLRTLTNPKQMGRNLERSVKNTANDIKKVGCGVGKLFGAKC